MKIQNIKFLKILDSRGEPTIKIRLETDKGIASACVPQGKSRGKHEAIALSPDNVKDSVKKVNLKLKNKEIKNQKELDDLLLNIDNTKNKKKIGGNVMLGISMAFARACSRYQNKKLYIYLRELLGEKSVKINDFYVLFNMINGGKHALIGPQIQEYLLVLPFDRGRGIWKAVDCYKKIGRKLKAGAGDEGGYVVNVKNEEKPLKILSEIIKGTDIRLGVDVAASQISRKINIKKLIKKYNLLYIEDPFSEDSWEKFSKLKKKLTQGNLIVGDDLTVSKMARIKKAVKENCIDGVIIKPNQIGTISETLESIKVAKKNNLKVIVSHRSGETCDSFIADLAIACNAWGIKAGAPRGSERNVKYNRLLEIIN